MNTYHANNYMFFLDGEVPDTLSTDYRYEGKEGQSPMDITEKMTKGA